MNFRSLNVFLIGFQLCQLLPGSTNTLLRLDPHQYPAARGNEPQEQLVGSLHQEWADPLARTPSDLSLHFSAEVRGRRDVSFDIDRAWFSLGQFTLGRIHPYDLSGHFDSHRPWGLLGSAQSQNRGLLLGYEFSSSIEPSPILLGLIGVHYWSDRSHLDKFEWGFSFSPFFIPTMGSELTLSSKEPANVGRFARRPPGTVDVDGKKYPFYFELDRSRLWQDVILNPQAYLQFRSGNTWLVLSRSPSPDPLITSQEDYVVVTPDSVHIFAKVTPRFEQREGATLTHRLPILGKENAIFGSLSFYGNRYWGYELGVDSPYAIVSLLEERNYSALTTENPTTESRYSDLLAQIDIKVPFDTFTFSGGVKHHLRQNDLWIRSGLAYQATSHLTFQSILDVFAGPDQSYFGEWRSNDRISLVMTWGFNS